MIPSYSRNMLKLTATGTVYDCFEQNVKELSMADCRGKNVKMVSTKYSSFSSTRCLHRNASIRLATAEKIYRAA